MKKNTFQSEKDKENILKINSILDDLPDFVKDYFVSRRANTQTRTRLAYAYDINKFFNWLCSSFPYFMKKDKKEIKIKDLERLKTRDIEDYLFYLQTSETNANSHSGLARKLSSLNSFFNYFFIHEEVASNPCSKVPHPKIHDIEIIRLEPNEVSILLDTIKNPQGKFTKKQIDYLEKTKERDLCITLLLLSTGIRVSECVGLNVGDVNLEECKMKITRKGGNVQRIAMGDEAIAVLRQYMGKREEVMKNVKEDALFVSMQKRRMSVQAIENMIEKYAKGAGIAKPITPHKLRKTFGTELYKQTKDIYLVAEFLGHKNVATTTKHYAAQTEENLMSARNAVKFF